MAGQVEQLRGLQVKAPRAVKATNTATAPGSRAGAIRYLPTLSVTASVIRLSRIERTVLGFGELIEENYMGDDTGVVPAAPQSADTKAESRMPCSREQLIRASYIR